MADPAAGRRQILAAAVVGLIVRLAFGLLYWVDKPLTHDEREYLALAQSVAAGRGFVYDASHDTGTAQQFGRAPVYPLFLAIVGAGRGEHVAAPARVKVAQSIVGAIGVGLIGLLARRAAGPRAGIAAAAIAAVYPPLVWISAYVFSEALYSTLALLAALLLDTALDRSAGGPAEDRGGPGISTYSLARPHLFSWRWGPTPSAGPVAHARSVAAEGSRSPSREPQALQYARSGSAMAAAAGLTAGLAILARPAMLLFLPLAALWLIAHRRPSLAVALVVTSLAVITPWTVRNARVYGRFVLIASEGGVTFWTGNHPLARGEGDLAANPDIKIAELAFRAAHPGLTAEQLEPLYYREALHYIARHPLWWLGLLAKKAFYTIVPIGPSYTLHSTRYLVSSVISYLLLLPFAAAGARAWRRGGRRPEALFVLAASAVIVGLVFFPQERFRIPVIDPALIVCAAVACAGRLKTQ
jgi:4-amino-4-deoxy-L-arabinose transferase-like glycosyltransferase